jgi:integrase
VRRVKEQVSEDDRDSGCEHRDAEGEILGLEWQRIDLSSARITLYETKNDNPRGAPINRAVYEALIALEPDKDRRQGRLFRRRDGAA